MFREVESCGDEASAFSDSCVLADMGGLDSCPFLCRSVVGFFWDEDGFESGGLVFGRGWVFAAGEVKG